MQAFNMRVGVSAAIVKDGAVLLVEFNDKTGTHFNFPGGGVEPGESLHEALRREVREETGLEVTVGRLLLFWDYVPAKLNHKYGPIHKPGLLFECQPLEGSLPRLPDQPDPNQVAVRWVRFNNFAHEPPLLPSVIPQLLEVLKDPGKKGAYYVPTELT